MVLNKATASFLAGAGVLVLGIAGGYIASLYLYDDFLDQGKTQIQEALTSAAPSLKDISIDFYENQDSGIFNRNLTMVVINNGNKITCPVLADIGYLNYNFDLAFDQAKFGDKFLKELDGFKDILSLQANVSATSFSNKISLTVNGIYVDPYASEYLKSYKESILKEYTNKLNISEQTNFSLVADLFADKSSKVSLKLDNVFADTLFLKDVSLYLDSRYSEYGYPGVLKLNISDIVDFSFVAFTSSVSNFTTVFDYSNIKPNGDLDVKYNIKADSLDLNIKDFNLSGTFSGLNLKGIKELESSLGEDVLSNTYYYLSENTFNLTLDEGSGFKVYDKSKKDKYSDPQDDVFTISAKGNLMYSGQNSAESNFEITSDKDLTTLYNNDIASLGTFLIKENNQYKARIYFKGDHHSDPVFLINNQKVFN